MRHYIKCCRHYTESTRRPKGNTGLDTRTLLRYRHPNSFSSHLQFHDKMLRSPRVKATGYTLQLLILEVRGPRAEVRSAKRPSISRQSIETTRRCRESTHADTHGAARVHTKFFQHLIISYSET